MTARDEILAKVKNALGRGDAAPSDRLSDDSLNDHSPLPLPHHTSLSPPQVALDGKIFALNAADGSQKWVYQRTNPPLTVRRFAGGSISRGGLFTGTPGGKLLALDLNTGSLGWEASVATPKGATELERIADVTSTPVVEEKQVCAAAFQGRVACFEILRGTLL